MTSVHRRSSLSPVRSLLSLRTLPATTTGQFGRLVVPRAEPARPELTIRGGEPSPRLWDNRWLDRLSMPLSRIRE